MTLSARQPKPKKCQNAECGKEFVPRYRSTEKVCSNACALAVGRADQSIQAKARKSLDQLERKELGKRREKLKSRQDHLREAQAAFNEFIRLRDKDEPCICCGSFGADEDWLVGGKWDAGHFLSRGAYPELRFDEDNCHKQLKSCNAGSSKYAKKGRTVSQGYRDRLIGKIGLERVLRLEGPHDPRKYPIEELKTIKAHYRALVREMKKEVA